MRVVQLFSGGFDSTAQGLILQAEGHTIHPIYIVYRVGGSQNREMALLNDLAAACDFQPPILITREMSRGERYTYRNRLFCRIASEHAQPLGIKRIAIATSWFHGGPIHYRHEPEDCDIELYQKMVPQDMVVWDVQAYKSVLLAKVPPKRRHLIFGSTSCQKWFTDECGRCYTCIERHAAFNTVMGYDHTQYALNPKNAPRWREYIMSEMKAYKTYKETLNESA